MATEKQANKAREEHSSSLRDLGAHAIAVDKLMRQGKSTFGVVIFIDRKPSKPLPKSLEIKVGKRKIEVPITWRVASMAELE